MAKRCILSQLFRNNGPVSALERRKSTKLNQIKNNKINRNDHEREPTNERALVCMSARSAGDMYAEARAAAGLFWIKFSINQKSFKQNKTSF